VSEAPLSAVRAPAPGTLGSLRPPLLNLFLFALTAVSAFMAGALLTDTQLPVPTRAEAVQHGLSFSAALLAILLAHEMGHFVLARRHGVDATWPFFIPAPLLSLIGTLGAVIKLRSLPRTRTALVDIGAAGPIAGFLVTIPVLWVGLKLSTIVPQEGPFAHWTLFDALSSWLREGRWISLRDGFDLGRPLGMMLIERLARDVPAGYSLALHPVAVAGWFGLLLTALNLLPLGQLDGGHCLYSASPALHRAIGAPVSALLFALGVITPFFGWALWGLITGLFLNTHPPVAEAEPSLSRGRRLVLLVSLAIFILSFTPVPLLPLAG
jgi:membrane-associated protease RseP (regulator of RpoE activity)